MPQSPILVVGCGHSGTSLMLAMLGEHSAIYAVPGETNFLRRKWRRFSMAKFQLAAWLAGKQVWAEKTPKHIHNIADMARLAPEARIICMLRDGRDVALSIKKRTGSFEEGARRWVGDNEAWMAQRDHARILPVQYEKLVGSPEAEMRRISDFLGLGFEEGTLHPENTKKNWYARSARTRAKAHETLRNEQINQPIFDGSNQWRDKITSEELALFEAISGDMSARLGYA